MGLRSCYDLLDPAFGRLKANEVRATWAMLAARATELELTFEVKHADEGSGAVHWEVVYPFSKTGRRVHNTIEAQFGFHEGVILAIATSSTFGPGAARPSGCRDCCWGGRRG